MGEGYSLGGFAGIIGVNRTTISEWMNSYEEFSLAVGRAKARRLTHWETEMLTGARTKESGNPTLIIFGLKNAGSDEWRDQTETKHLGPDGGPLQIMEIDDATRAKALAAFLAKVDKNGG